MAFNGLFSHGEPQWVRVFPINVVLVSLSVGKGLEFLSRGLERIKRESALWKLLANTSWIEPYSGG